ncbi:hypothetical protein, partial [Xanthomonas vasicola]
MQTRLLCAPFQQKFGALDALTQGSNLICVLHRQASRHVHARWDHRNFPSRPQRAVANRVWSARWTAACERCRSISSTGSALPFGKHSRLLAALRAANKTQEEVV